MNKTLKDRYGNELKVGSPVLFCRYKRSSELEEGVITRITDSMIDIKGRCASMKIDGMEDKLILNPYVK